MDFVVIGLISAGFGYFLYNKLFKKKAPNADSEALKRLTFICRGDHERVQRLINLEKKRAPNLSTDSAIKRAISSYQRDQ
jgi:hypothetical protein